MNRKKIYRDVRARFTDKDSDADIIAKLEVQNNLLTGKVSYLQAENGNLKRLYDELTEKYKAVKWKDIC